MTAHRKENEMADETVLCLMRVKPFSENPLDALLVCGNEFPCGIHTTRLHKDLMVTLLNEPELTIPSLTDRLNAVEENVEEAILYLMGNGLVAD